MEPTIFCEDASAPTCECDYTNKCAERCYDLFDREYPGEGWRDHFFPEYKGPFLKVSPASADEESSILYHGLKGCARMKEGTFQEPRCEILNCSTDYGVPPITIHDPPGHSGNGSPAPLTPAYCAVMCAQDDPARPDTWNEERKLACESCCTYWAECVETNGHHAVAQAEDEAEQEEEKKLAAKISKTTDGSLSPSGSWRRR